MLFSRSQLIKLGLISDPLDKRDINDGTDRRQETQFSDRQTRRGPSTFGKALNVKDYVMGLDYGAGHQETILA